MPGPIGSPVARSQTIVDARWLEMPTASTGPGGVERGARCGRAHAAAIAAASNCDEAVGGVSGSSSCETSWANVASARTTAARTLLVPTSMTSTLPFDIGLRPGERRRTGEGARACPG